MTEQFTKRSSRNYFQRLGDSLVGTILGFILILVSIGLLIFNEGRSVNALRGLDAGGRSAVSVEGASVSPTNEGKLVHVTGNSASASPIIDTVTGASVDNALLLARQVEMYQWKETTQTQTRDKVGGTQETITTYTYTKEWSSDPFDSDSFAEKAGRINPDMTVTSTRLTASGATLGSFSLSGKLLDRLNPDTPVVLAAAPAGWQLVDGGLFKGTGTPTAPQVGDIRVRYMQAPAGQALSVMGRQTGSEITSWSDNAQSYEILMAEAGTKTVADMIKTEKSAEGVLTWVLRLLGIGLSWAGFGLMLKPLSALGNVVPLFATIIGAGTGLVAFGLGMSLSLVVIAVAWFAVRPILSFVLMAAAIGIWWFTKGKHRAPTAAPEPATS